MRTVRGKLALITGAASGIGRAIALALARRGANLFLVDINRPQLTLVSAEARAFGGYADEHVADLSQAEDVHNVVRAVLDRWAGVDILVNNAGIVFYGATEQMTEEQWQRVLAVNLHAPLQLTRELLPTLLARPEAHILNVCSIAGMIATPRLTAYNVSKFALVGLSESLRVEYGRRGLGVTALCPGIVRTNIFRSAITNPGKSLPRIPSWLTMSPERVATQALHAIERNRSVVLVPFIAWLLWMFKRLAPGLFDRVQQFRWQRRKAAVGSPLVPRFDVVAEPNDERRAA